MAHRRTCRPVKLAYAIVDKVGMPHVLAFIAARLERYDTSNLESVKLLPLHRSRLLHGACNFPCVVARRTGRYRRGYRIRASVNVEMAPPFSYVHWGRIPASNSRQGWRSGERVFAFDDLEECAVHTLAHECFHFLSHSAQVDWKNTEANANWWADQWSGEYRGSADGEVVSSPSPVA